ncbi:MAG: hypothetical protein R3208_04280 [Ketobacteraceae bacterium]|nr:hypothetical protein [Ketobacteraceae bacterium]
MAYLIIIFAILLVIGPVLWLQPSKQERQLAKLRQAAMADGAKIQPISIRKDPVYSATLARNPHLDDHRWIRYQWVATENESGPAVKETWVQRKDREQGLVWEPRQVTSKEPEEVTAMLATWREHQDGRFLALELGPRSVAIVWTEKTTPQEVKELAEKIRRLFFTSKS